jgi:hypothetical protein
MKRHQQILAGVLAVQLILSVLVLWPRSAVGREAAPVFPDLVAEDVVALTITDDTGQRVRLRKEGEGWVLANADDYPAQADKVMDVLEKLPQLTTGSLVARTDTSHQQLQVTGDNFVRRLDIETQDGTEHTLYLGSAPRYTATHFRVAGQNETYLTTELATWELNAGLGGWVDTAYQDIDAATLAEITLENVHGTLTLVKSGETWTLPDLGDDETVAPGKIGNVVNKASRVVMAYPLGKDAELHGFEVPTATVTLTDQDGAVTTLRVGPQLPDSPNYVVTSSASPYYVAVGEFNVTPLFSSREDLLEQPPEEPTPAPEP